MTAQEAADLETITPNRFDVELFIVHPTLTPAEISRALELNAVFAHRVGDRRQTPKRTLLPGTYPDTRWRHSRRYEASDHRFADKITELINCIEPHKAFLRGLRSTGGRAYLLVQFLGDGYLSDAIPWSTLARLADLELDFGIECFVDPQSK